MRQAGLAKNLRQPGLPGLRAQHQPCRWHPKMAFDGCQIKLVDEIGSLPRKNVVL
jgi:hypothetical protein